MTQERKAREEENSVFFSQKNAKLHHLAPLDTKVSLWTSEIAKKNFIFGIRTQKRIAILAFLKIWRKFAQNLNQDRVLLFFL
jgi:hypothetical protein